MSAARNLKLKVDESRRSATGSTLHVSLELSTPPVPGTILSVACAGHIESWSDVQRCRAF